MGPPIKERNTSLSLIGMQMINSMPEAALFWYARYTSAGINVPSQTGPHMSGQSFCDASFRESVSSCISSFIDAVFVSFSRLSARALEASGVLQAASGLPKNTKALLNSPFARGLAASRKMEAAPASKPIAVIRSGSPPKAAIFSLIHLRAAI